MENYTEWINNKMYQGHIRRLTQIKAKQYKIPKTAKNFRIKSQPSNCQTEANKNFFPLPLVSKNERLLLGSVVKQRTMSLRQKQSLLENYMLSKRILETHSVFDTKLLKKQFNFHRKVSENMNRNQQKNRRTFSQLRKKRIFSFYQEFSQLQKLKEENCLGLGKISFKLKLKEIMLIKRKIEDNKESKFNLIYRPEKFKTYRVKALTFTELISNWHHFKATENQSERKNGLKFEIEQVRGNDAHKLCEFRVHLNIQQPSITEELQITSFSNFNPQLITINPKNLSPKQKEIIKNNVQKLLHPVSKFLIGTVQFTVKSNIINLQEE